jgi:hypothetical protein
LVLVVAGASILRSGRASADLIATPQVTVLGGSFVPIIIPTASGQAKTTDPGGMKVKPMPLFGGNIRQKGNIDPADNTPYVISHANVNLAKGTAGSGWVAEAVTGKSTGAGTKADIDFTIVGAAPVLAATTVKEQITLSLAPGEVDDAFFGPDVTGNLMYNLSVKDLSSGAVLLDSVSTFTEASPSTVTDNTGQLQWTRVPGPFDGLSTFGDLGGLSNVSSPNHWILGPLTLTVTEMVTLNPGETLNSDLDVAISLSGASSGGSSIYGFSNAAPVPEPSSGALAAVAVALLVVFRARKDIRRTIPGACGA